MGEQKTQNEVHIKIGVDGIEFDAKGDADFIERERNAFEAKLLPLGVDAVARARNVVQVQQIGTQETCTALPMSTSVEDDSSFNEDLNKMSLASFIKQKGADSNNDFVLCAAYFKEKKKEIQSFSSTTAKEFFQEAKKPLPSNISMVINQLGQKGFIMEDASSKGANPKEYIVSSEGDRYIETLKPKEEKEKKVSNKPRKSRTKAESIYASINIDDLNRSNYPDIKSLKSPKEKMMTILYMVTNEGKGEWFTTADVSCLMTDVFGESVGNQTIIDLFSKNKTWFKSEKIEGSSSVKQHKLLNGGIDFAKRLAQPAV